MRSNQEILRHINQRHDFWSDHLKRLKTYRKPDATAIKITEALMDELRDIAYYINT